MMYADRSSRRWHLTQKDASCKGFPPGGSGSEVLEGYHFGLTENNRRPAEGRAFLSPWPAVYGGIRHRRWCRPAA